MLVLCCTLKPARSVASFLHFPAFNSSPHPVNSQNVIHQRNHRGSDTLATTGFSARTKSWSVHLPHVWFRCVSRVSGCESDRPTREGVRPALHNSHESIRLDTHPSLQFTCPAPMYKNWGRNSRTFSESTICRLDSTIQRGVSGRGALVVDSHHSIRVPIQRPARTYRDPRRLEAKGRHGVVFKSSQRRAHFFGCQAEPVLGERDDRRGAGAGSSGTRGGPVCRRGRGREGGVAVGVQGLAELLGVEAADVLQHHEDVAVHSFLPCVEGSGRLRDGMKTRRARMHE